MEIHTRNGRKLFLSALPAVDSIDFGVEMVASGTIVELVVGLSKMAVEMLATVDSSIFSGVSSLTIAVFGVVVSSVAGCDQRFLHSNVRSYVVALYKQCIRRVK